MTARLLEWPTVDTRESPIQARFTRSKTVNRDGALDKELIRPVISRYTAE